MFSTTFLGHQGWLFHTGRSRLLIDPLLTEDIGHCGLGKIYPPRTIDLTSFPPVDALFITHEHEDHFHISSFARVDRSIPVLLSARSSSAARTFLREIGFQVQLLGPGDAVTIGDLQLFCFSPNHKTDDNGDEWDVLQFFVRDTYGHGSFFSGVDTSVSAETLAKIRAIDERPGIRCFTNNSVSWEFLYTGRFLREPPINTLRLAAFALTELADQEHSWKLPVASLWCGGGWYLADDRRWMNEYLWHADSNRIAQAVSAALPEHLSLAPLPGQTLTMSDGVLDETSKAPWIRVATHSTWPVRRHVPEATFMGSYQPATGRCDLASDELDEIIAGLADFARHLYGRKEFRSLYSMSREVLGGRRAAIAIALLADAERGSYVLEYEPQSCGFVVSDSENPARDYVSGMECWGSDLLALIRGELPPTSVVFGRSRAWNSVPEYLMLILTWIWDYFHPLVRGAQFLNLYHRLMTREAGEVTRIRPGGAGVAPLVGATG